MLHARRALVVLVSVVVGLAAAIPVAFASDAAAVSPAARASRPRAEAVREHEPAAAGRAATLGYWVVASNGGIYSAGTAAFQGSPASLAAPIVGMAATPSGHGYWQVASDGGIFAFGDAAFHGSTGAIDLNEPIVGIAATPSGHGYWLVASDGGIFSFGDAAFHGSTGAMHLNQPIVGMAATPSGNGYWLVASDGGIFSFGDAAFHGSTGAMHLHAPIVGMSASPSGDGYHMVASDGGVFSFGDAPFEGSTGAMHLAQPIVGMTPTGSGDGYWFVARDGGVFAFGDAQFYGSLGGSGLTTVVGMAASNAVSAGAAAKLAFRTQPSDSTGGTAFASQPQVAVEDASGAVVATDTSTVTVSLTNAEPGTPAPSTLTCTARTRAAVAGIATFAGCRIDHAGTYTLTATDGSLTSAVSTLITITPGAAARLRFLTQPSGAVTGVALGTQPVVAIVDAGNNVVEGNTSAVTLALTTPGGANLACTANPKSAVAGIATFAGCSVSLAGSYTFTATDGSLTSAVSSSLQITGAAAKVAFTTEPSAATTGGVVLTTQPVVTVQDASGHTIEADTSTVALTLTSAGGATLSCTTNPKAAVAGVATFAGCTIDRPGTYTLTATDGSLTTAVSTGVVVSIGAAAKVVFTTQPVGASGGTALATQPVATIEDAGGNTVTSNTSAVTLALTTPGGATLACTTNPLNAVAGVATFAGCHVDHANTYTFTASDGSLTAAVSNVFTISVGAASRVAFTTQPAGAVGGTPFTSQPVVAIQDAGGNTVSGNTSSVTLVITTPAGATLTCTTNPKAAVAGVATFAGCRIDLAGSYTLTASDGSLTTAVSTSFANAVGAASQVVFTTEPSGGVGGSAFATQPVVAVEDAGGNAVTANTSAVTLSLTTAGGATLVCAANPRSAIAGVATFSGCNVDLAGSYTLTASDGLLAPATSGSITITPGTATQLRFTTEPGGSGTGGTPFTTQPVVAIADSIGNTVTGNATAVTLALTTPAGATLACTANPKTAVSGVATFSGCNIDRPGTYTLTATDASLTAATSTSVVITVGAAAQVVFTTQPGGGTAGTAFATQPVVTVEDAGGNTVTGNTSSVTLAITSAGGATLTCTANPKAAAAGVATFAGCNVDFSGSFSFTATDGSLSADVSDLFTITPGPAAQLAIVSDPIVGTGGTPFDSQPQVAVEDSFGNIVRTDTSAVTLALTSVGPTLSCTTNPVNAVEGVATFAGCAVDEAGSWTMHATDGSLTLASTDVVIEVGDPAQLAFTTQPSSSTGGVPFATQPAVTVKDAGGNTVSADASSVVLSLTSAGGATLACTANPKTAVSGVATFAGCNIDLAGTYSLTAHDASLTAAVSSSLDISVGDAAKVAFTAQPSASTGGVAFATQPKVTVEDAGGNPVTSDTTAVTLAITTPAGATLTCTANPVNASAGVATFTGCAIDLAAPSYTLTATDGSLTSGTSQAFSIGVGPAVALEFAVQPVGSFTSTNFPTQPHVAVVDAGGNPVTTDASSVTLTLNGAGGSLTCIANPRTVVGGQANFAGCQIDTAGTYTITASDGSLTPVDSNDVTVEDPV